MKFLFASLLVLLALSCASAPHPLVVVTPPTGAVIVQFIPAIDGLAVSVDQVSCGRTVDGIATCLAITEGPHHIQYDDPGLAILSIACTPVACDAPAVVVVPNHNNDVSIWMQLAHRDPRPLTLVDLARIRGAMWTARLEQLPPKDLIAFAFYPFYRADERARMVAAYTAKGYTHVVSGPIAGTDCYHGLWPCHDPQFPAWMPVDEVPSQAQFDAYLDLLQELWDQGLTPVCFVKPDGWERTLERLDQLDALYRQPRAQALCRVVVYPGWEPSGDKYGWSNATYVAMVKRGASVFPDALRLLHTVADLDAPTGQHDDQLGMTNGQAWKNVAPYIHGWLAQYGGYALSGNCTPTDQFKRDFADAITDAQRRFHTGYAGWPTNSAWGPDQPVRVYAGEYAAYVGLWHNCPETPSVELGAIAMAAGADGFLDGGR